MTNSRFNPNVKYFTDLSGIKLRKSKITTEILLMMYINSHTDVINMHIQFRQKNISAFLRNNFMAIFYEFFMDKLVS